MRAAWWALMAGCATAATIHAQTYPTRPVRLVSPYAPGGGTDILARTMAQKLTESLGQSVVVENRPGGGGILGTESVARAAPDGYTLLLGSKGPLIMNPALHAKLPYDTQRDLAPIAMISRAPALLAVHPSLPVRSVQELAAMARAGAGQLSFSSSGNGGSGHLAGELFNSIAGVKMTHIAYRGTGPATLAVVSGEVPVTFGNTVAVLPHVATRRLRGIAVTGTRRIDAAPEYPTVEEAGLKGYDYVTWYGVLAPAGTPREIVARLNRDIVESLRHSDMIARLKAEGAEAAGNTPEQFAEYIRIELVRWARIVKEAGIRAD